MGFGHAMMGAAALAAVLAAPAPLRAQFVNPFVGLEVPLTQADMQEMHETVTALLTGNEKPGASASWENGATGRKGVITLLDTNSTAGLTCHKVRYAIAVPTPAKVRNFILNWCKAPDGWKIAS